jgi:hypothetical protein
VLFYFIDINNEGADFDENSLKKTAKKACVSRLR